MGDVFCPGAENAMGSRTVIRTVCWFKNIIVRGGNVVKANNISMNAFIYEHASLLLEEYRVICHAERYEACIADCARSGAGKI